MMKRTEAERFWSHVDKSGDCWLWTSTRLRGGYGQFMTEGTRLAHRVAWRLMFGPIPAGLVVCHSCDVKACVNPGHLFLGTYQDNVDDMIAKGRNPQGESWHTAARLEARPKGSSHGHAKLTDADVREIRRRFRVGDVTKASLAEEFSVSAGAIRNIVTGRNWTHLAEVPA